MSNFQRLLNMASKALDKNSQSSSTGTGKTGDTDWRDLVRTAADKVTGDSRPAAHTSNPEPSAPNATDAPRSARPSASTPAPATASAPAGSAEDRAAIGRYDYLLKTAQPEQLEQVHRDAFARLTPAQREQLNAQLRTELPANEMPASTSADDLARAATRGEAQHPGFLRKVFGKTAGRSALGAGAVGAVAGAGLGAAGGLLAAVAGGAVLSSVAAPLLEQAAGLGVDFENLAGGFDGVTEGLADGASEYTSGLADGASEYTSGLGEKVSDFGSNFEIPGLGDLGKLFGRD